MSINHCVAGMARPTPTLVLHGKQILLSSVFALCKATWIPKSEKLLVNLEFGKFCLWKPESWIYSACGIWNRTNDWNPESKVPLTKNPESTNWNLESTAWNPESKLRLSCIPLHGAIGLVPALVIGHTTPFKFLNACRLKSLRLCSHMNDIILLWTCSLEWTVYESIRLWPCGWRSSSLLSRRRKGWGGGGSKEGKKRGIGGRG